MVDSGREFRNGATKPARRVEFWQDRAGVFDGLFGAIEFRSDFPPFGLVFVIGPDIEQVICERIERRRAVPFVRYVVGEVAICFVQFAAEFLGRLGVFQQAIKPRFHNGTKSICGKEATARAVAHGSEHPAFGKRKRLVAGNDQMIEYANINKGERGL